MAVDGREETSPAVEAAVELATGTGSELHLVYVVRVAPAREYSHSRVVNELERERNEARLEWRRLGGLKILEERLREVERLGGSVAASHYREGIPDREVVRLAREIGAGLILTGGERRSWFRRIFGYGFSENVFRRADRPVLVVGKRERRSTVPR